jgi:hypothetical protein
MPKAKPSTRSPLGRTMRRPGEMCGIARLLFYSPRCFRLGLFVFCASEGPLTTHLDTGSTRCKDLKPLLGLEHDISVVFRSFVDLKAGKNRDFSAIFLALQKILNPKYRMPIARNSSGQKKLAS